MRLQTASRMRPRIFNLALYAVVDALQTSNFDAEDIDEALKEFRAALAKLSKTATRNINGSDAGEGVAWLKAIGAIDITA